MAAESDQRVPPRRRRVQPSPAVNALRVERMLRANMARRRNAGEVAAELGALDGMTLEEVARRVAPRLQTVALLHIGGYSLEQIKQALGYAQKTTVMRALRRPEVKRIIELVNRARYEAVIQGQYGAVNAARAASTTVVENLVGLAGAAPPDPTGQRPGRATRDRDLIAAGQTVLNVAGVSVQRHEHRHVHEVLFDSMTDAELETLAEKGAWPERLKHATALLPGDATDA